MHKCVFSGCLRRTCAELSRKRIFRSDRIRIGPRSARAKAPSRERRSYCAPRRQSHPLSGGHRARDALISRSNTAPLRKARTPQQAISTFWSLATTSLSRNHSSRCDRRKNASAARSVRPCTPQTQSRRGRSDTAIDEALLSVLIRVVGEVAERLSVLGPLPQQWKSHRAPASG